MTVKFENQTNIKDFVLVGFPGLQQSYYGPVSALLLLTFVTIVAGNSFIAAFILYERTLHKPTYVIFFNLAMTDIVFAFATLPKIIARYWWNDMMCSFGACFTQMYFVHSMGSITSLILMTMAVDRFVAIWLPFQYPVSITTRSIAIGCALCWVGTFTRMVGVVFHALTLPYCNSNVIQQCYCDHISITKLACGPNVAYIKLIALSVALLNLLGPLGFIIVSYISIIFSVLRVPANERRLKVLSTCVPQILITCLFYVPRCFVYLANNLGYRFSVDGQIVITMLYSLLPCVVNPLIYCFKTKDIKQALVRRFQIYRAK
ncbi:olfactory receptor 52Z1P-like [Neosynchiropus ocellatus]